MQEDTIKVTGILPSAERAAFLSPLITASTEEAAKRGQSLTLIRPKRSRFYTKPKAASLIEEERRAYIKAAGQLSLMDEELAALAPCPVAFHFDYETQDGRKHKATCDDWETAATFYNWRERYGEAGALRDMSQVFNDTYPLRGMAFVMGTHSRYPTTWLLIGVIRLDDPAQSGLNL